MKTQKTVLITGASGFIGRHTVKRLAANGWMVYAQHLPAENPASLDNVSWFPCDLSDPAATQSWPAQCDHIIYLAQSPLWRNFPEGAQDVFEVNVAAVIRSIEYARLAGSQCFIFASSGSVYSQTSVAARENEPLDISKNRNFYTASKLAAELLIGSYQNLMSVISLRFFMPYGNGQNPNMLIPNLVQRVREHQAIELHGNNGMQLNPVTIADLTETLERCLMLGKSATLNVAGPEILSLRQIGECIGRITENVPEFTCHPEQTEPVIIGDTTALKTHLDWVPQTGLDTGLRAWLRSEKPA